MATTVKEKITVKSLSKHGFFVDGAEKGYYWSKNIKDSEKGKVVPGGTYDMDVYIADSGAKYVNSVKSDAVAALKPLTPKPEKTVSKVITVDLAPTATAQQVANATMSKAEWSAKDRSQLIGGLSHDAAALVASALAVGVDVDVEKVLSAYKSVLVGLIKIRDEVK